MEAELDLGLDVKRAGDLKKKTFFCFVRANEKRKKNGSLFTSLLFQLFLTLGSWMNDWPERVLGGSSPVVACLRHSMIVCRFLFKVFKKRFCEVESQQKSKSDGNLICLLALAPSLLLSLSFPRLSLSFPRLSLSFPLLSLFFPLLLLTVFPAPLLPTINVSGL